MYLVLIFLLFGVTLVIRSLDVLRFEGYRSDTFYNLIIARLIKNNHYYYPEDNPYYVVKSEGIALPPFVPYLLAIFFNKISVRAMHLLPKIADLLTALLVYQISGSLFNQEAAFLAVAIYLSTTITMVECHGITARPFGNLFATVTLSALFYSAYEPLYLIWAVAFASLTMLTHRMATQTLFFSAIFLFLPFEVSDVNYFLYILVTILGGFILAVILSKGKYVYFLREHLLLIKFFYHRWIVERKQKKVVNPVMIFALNFWAVFSVLLAGFWMLFIFQQSNIIAFVSEPFLIPQNVQAFLLWSLTPVFMSLLWFCGEGERHMLFSTAPTAVVASWFILMFFKGEFVVLVAAFGITFGILTAVIGLLITKPSLAVTDSLKECLMFLKKTSPDSVVVCYPSSYGTYVRAVAFYSKKKVVRPDESVSGKISFQSLPDIQNHEAVKEFVEKYGVNYALVYSQELDTSSLPLDWKVVFANKEWKIYHLGTKNEKGG